MAILRRSAPVVVTGPDLCAKMLELDANILGAFFVEQGHLIHWRMQRAKAARAGKGGRSDVPAHAHTQHAPGP